MPRGIYQRTNQHRAIISKAVQNWANSRLARLVGLRVGLLVIQSVDVVEKTCQCLCDCGNPDLISVKIAAIQHRLGVKSCGCLKKNGPLAMAKINQKPFGHVQVTKLFCRYRICASRRKIEFRLSRDEASSLFQSPCFYCGLPPSMRFKYLVAGVWTDFFYSGIDRVNSNGPYEAENVVSCCKQCQYGKGTQTVQEFNSWIDRLTRYRQRLNS